MANGNRIDWQLISIGWQLEVESAGKRYRLAIQLNDKLEMFQTRVALEIIRSLNSPKNIKRFRP